MKRTRKKPLPGFPKTEKFKTTEEIKNYLSGDRITCLLCGKQYKELGVHIHMHDTTLHEYKEKYGIPWTYPLCSKKTSDKKSDKSKIRMENGFLPPPRTIDELTEISNKQRRPMNMPCHDNLNKKLRENYKKHYLIHGNYWQGKKRPLGNKTRKDTPKGD